MQRTYFEEVQTFRENRWVLALVIALSVFTLLPIAYGMRQQLVDGVPWGDEPMPDNGLIFMFLFVLLCIGIAAFVVLSSRLEVAVDAQGLRYRFFPITPKWKRLTRDEIASYTLEKHFKIFESGGFGHHRSILRKTRSYRIRGGHHLSLKLNNGQRLLLGTQNPEGMEWAMRKLMERTETI
jgi:hypothetical protein